MSTTTSKQNQSALAEMAAVYGNRRAEAITDLNKGATRMDAFLVQLKPVEKKHLAVLADLDGVWKKEGADLEKALGSAVLRLYALASTLKTVHQTYEGIVSDLHDLWKAGHELHEDELKRVKDLHKQLSELGEALGRRVKLVEESSSILQGLVKDKKALTAPTSEDRAKMKEEYKYLFELKAKLSILPGRVENVLHELHSFGSALISAPAPSDELPPEPDPDKPFEHPWEEPHHPHTSSPEPSSSSTPHSSGHPSSGHHSSEPSHHGHSSGQSSWLPKSKPFAGAPTFMGSPKKKA